MLGIPTSEPVTAAHLKFSCQEMHANHSELHQEPQVTFRNLQVCLHLKSHKKTSVTELLL